MNQPRWIRWFYQQTHSDQQTIALNALERLLQQQQIQFWTDDTIDKYGQPIHDNHDNHMAEEHLHWNDEHKEDLRIPF